jgi:hypothetical protein
MFPFVLSPLSPIYEPEMRRKFGLEGYLENWTHQTMDSKEAIRQLKLTFFELENSGPIYRADNLDIFFELPAFQRKKFVAERHRLAKLALTSGLKREDVFEAFSPILSDIHPKSA